MMAGKFVMLVLLPAMAQAEFQLCENHADFQPDLEIYWNCTGLTKATCKNEGVYWMTDGNHSWCEALTAGYYDMNGLTGATSCTAKGGTPVQMTLKTKDYDYSTQGTCKLAVSKWLGVNTTVGGNLTMPTAKMCAGQGPKDSRGSTPLFSYASMGLARRCCKGSTAAKPKDTCSNVTTPFPVCAKAADFQADYIWEAICMDIAKEHCTAVGYSWKNYTTCVMTKGMSLTEFSRCEPIPAHCTWLHYMGATPQHASAFMANCKAHGGYTGQYNQCGNRQYKWLGYHSKVDVATCNGVTPVHAPRTAGYVTRFMSENGCCTGALASLPKDACSASNSMDTYGSTFKQCNDPAKFKPNEIIYADCHGLSQAQCVGVAPNVTVGGPKTLVKGLTVLLPNAFLWGANGKCSIANMGAPVVEICTNLSGVIQAAESCFQKSGTFNTMNADPMTCAAANVAYYNQEAATMFQCCKDGPAEGAAGTSGNFFSTDDSNTCCGNAKCRDEFQLCENDLDYMPDQAFSWNCTGLTKATCKGNGLTWTNHGTETEFCLAESIVFPGEPMNACVKAGGAIEAHATTRCAQAVNKWFGKFTADPSEMCMAAGTTSFTKKNTNSYFTHALARAGCCKGATDAKPKDICTAKAAPYQICEKADDFQASYIHEGTCTGLPKAEHCTCPGCAWSTNGGYKNATTCQYTHYEGATMEDWTAFKVNCDSHSEHGGFISEFAQCGTTAKKYFGTYKKADKSTCEAAHPMHATVGFVNRFMGMQGCCKGGTGVAPKDACTPLLTGYGGNTFKMCADVAQYQPNKIMFAKCFGVKDCKNTTTKNAANFMVDGSGVCNIANFNGADPAALCTEKGGKLSQVQTCLQSNLDKFSGYKSDRATCLRKDIPIYKEQVGDGVQFGCCKDSKVCCDDETCSGFTKTTTTAKPPTAKPTTAKPATSGTTTTFDMEVAAATAAGFDLQDYAKSVAAETGVKASEVEVVKTDYTVTAEYKFSGTRVFTEAELKKSIAAALGVKETEFTLTISRRLGDAGRRLAVDTKVTATVTTTDAAAADKVQTAAKTVTSVVAELTKNTDQTPTGEVTKAPSMKVKVTTKVTAAKAITKPDAAKLDKIAKAAGGTGATMDAASWSTVTVTSAPTVDTTSGARVAAQLATGALMAAAMPFLLA